MKFQEEDFQERIEEMERGIDIMKQKSEKDRAEMLEWKEKYDLVVFSKKSALKSPQ